MADYHSPTVVQPNIPAADITPLERLILDLVSPRMRRAVSTIIHGAARVTSSPRPSMICGLLARLRTNRVKAA
jgi:hypothetical protein